MQTGALIVAAGMSSRMGDFKPMLNIGSITISQRIIANFHQAGVDRIVMITGYNAIALERHLSGNGIVFLRNENYETTHMFDSAKIGLEYLKDKVDTVLFTPVDIPLFSSRTIEKLLENDSRLAVPICEGQDGHPIKISSSLIDEILSYSGEGGLSGALQNCSEQVAKIQVDDPGILHDADTPEDYSHLLKMHNNGLVRPEIAVILSKEKPFFDNQMATLLSLIDETSSVRTACSRMQISYSTGWNIIRTLESQLTRTLIERTQGGSHGGKSYLTEYGKELLENYVKYTEEVKKFASEKFGDYFPDI